MPPVTINVALTISYETPSQLPNGPYIAIQAPTLYNRADPTKHGVLHCFPTPSLTIQQVHDLCLATLYHIVKTQQAAAMSQGIRIYPKYKILQMTFNGAFIDIVGHGAQTLQSFHAQSGQVLGVTVCEHIVLGCCCSLL